MSSNSSQVAQPHQSSADTLRGIMVATVELAQRCSNPERVVGYGYYHGLLEHGEWFGGLLSRSEIAELHPSVSLYEKRRPARPQECFKNAQLAVILELHGEYDYCEGLMLSDRLCPFPVEHGWIVHRDSKLSGDSRAIDLTVLANRRRKGCAIQGEESLAYVGVRIPAEFIRLNIVKTHCAGSLLPKYLHSLTTQTTTQNENKK